MVLASLLAAATVVGCAAISGLDKLEESACAPDCGTDATIDTGADVPLAESGDLGVDTLDAADTADTSDTSDAAEVASDADAADTADAADSATDTGASECGPTNTTTNCSACGVACDVSHSTGPVCDGTSCQYSGCASGWADCITTAPNANGCETPTITVNNCAGCGNKCDATNTTSTASCTGTTCTYGACKSGWADCNKAIAPNVDGCETNIATDELNCTACGVRCDVSQSVGPTCNGTSCVYNSCRVGYSDCNKTAPDSDGCECHTPTCCNTGCAVTHQNCQGTACGPVGQSYFLSNGCTPVGTPGSAATYNLAMATAARAAWPQTGTDGNGSCGGSSALSRQNSTACVVWLYDGTLAGSVTVNTTPGDGGLPDCLCSASITTSWN